MGTAYFGLIFIAMGIFFGLCRIASAIETLKPETKTEKG